MESMEAWRQHMVKIKPIQPVAKRTLSFFLMMLDSGEAECQRTTVTGKCFTSNQIEQTFWKGFWHLVQHLCQIWLFATVHRVWYLISSCCWKLWKTVHKRQLNRHTCSTSLRKPKSSSLVTQRAQPFSCIPLKDVSHWVASGSTLNRWQVSELEMIGRQKLFSCDCMCALSWSVVTF